MKVLGNADIFAVSRPIEMIDALSTAFAEPFASPDRMHCDLPGDDEAKLLVMPAWQGRDAIGVKVATVMPENGRKGCPTVNGVYVLIDGQNGSVRAVLEAPALTALRTAATSALASRYMSRPDSASLLVVGTGALAPHLVRAHAAVRTLRKVMIWGRNPLKAKSIANALADLECEVSVVEDLASATATCDIVSCATLSSEPLIQAGWVKPGMHLDFVGSFTPDMREADPALFETGRLVIDTPTALKESGDLIEPAARGWLRDPVTELADLIRGAKSGRSNSEELTIFKSVGTGLTDIAAAAYVLEKVEAAARCGASVTPLSGAKA